MFESWMNSLGYSVFPLLEDSKRPDGRLLYSWGYRSTHSQCGGRGCSKCWDGEIGSWAPLQDDLLGSEAMLAWGNVEGRPNMGIVTGGISGIVVVDFDSKPAWDHYQSTLGAFVGAGCVVQTLRGFHAYFRHTGEEIRNGAGIRGKYDIRGDGGYVVGPTSKIGGGEYLVIHGNLADKACWPGFDPNVWLPDPNREMAAGSRDVTSVDRYRSAIIEGEFQRVSQAANGHRHDALKLSAIKFGNYVAGGVIDHGEGFGILMGASIQCGLPESEARSCILAGFAIGSKNPRTIG